MTDEYGLTNERALITDDDLATCNHWYEPAYTPKGILVYQCYHCQHVLTQEEYNNLDDIPF